MVACLWLEARKVGKKSDVVGVGSFLTVMFLVLLPLIVGLFFDVFLNNPQPYFSISGLLIPLYAAVLARAYSYDCNMEWKDGQTKSH